MTDGLARKVFLAEIAAVREHLAEQTQPTTPAAQPQPLGTPATPRVLAEIGYERTRQDAKWGQQNHPDGTGPDLETPPGWTAAELADAARNSCQRRAEMGIGTWSDIFTEEACEALAESDPARLRAELIQVAATAVNWIEAIDRRNNTT